MSELRYKRIFKEGIWIGDEDSGALEDLKHLNLKYGPMIDEICVKIRSDIEFMSKARHQDYNDDLNFYGTSQSENFDNIAETCIGSIVNFITQGK